MSAWGSLRGAAEAALLPVTIIDPRRGAAADGGTPASPDARRGRGGLRQRPVVPAHRGRLARRRSPARASAARRRRAAPPARAVVARGAARRRVARRGGHHHPRGQSPPHVVAPWAWAGWCGSLRILMRWEGDDGRVIPSRRGDAPGGRRGLHRGVCASTSRASGQDVAEARRRGQTVDAPDDARRDLDGLSARGPHAVTTWRAAPCTRHRAARLTDTDARGRFRRGGPRFESAGCHRGGRR